MRRVAQFLWDLWPVILFYLVVSGIIVFGVLRHPDLMFRDKPVEPFLPNGSETVPHRVSCYVRNQFNYDTDAEGGYCQPETYNI